MLGLSMLICRLSTPHGTLGTESKPVQKKEKKELSTPHGTLGTKGNVSGCLYI